MEYQKKMYGCEILRDFSEQDIGINGKKNDDGNDLLLHFFFVSCLAYIRAQ